MDLYNIINYNSISSYGKACGNLLVKLQREVSDKRSQREITITK